jgi:hypothetical protein
MWRGVLILLVALLPTYGAPQISKVEPLAVGPGKRTVLTFSGSGLDSVSNLWTSFPSEAKRVANTNSGRVSFSILCPPDASGVQAVQLIGPDGASGFELIMVDHLRTAPAAPDHRSPEKAAPIEPPVAVDGVLKSEQIDYYKFSAKAGQSYSIEAIAHRIGSQMDPVVRVLSKSGDELAFCDDEGGVWKDARFRFTAPLTDEYIVAVHDVGYAGGNNYAYRLRLSTDPLVWYTFPLSDGSESGARFEAIGEGLTAATGSPGNPPATATFAAVPQVFELEPNDQRGNSQSIGIGMHLNGKIESASDVDHYQFSAAKGERLIFQSQTRSLGSPCDLVLRILKPDGTALVQSDSSSAGDAVVTNRFEEAGSYLLEVRELTGYGVTNAPYRIAIREFEAGFELRTENNVLEVKPGESAKLKISAVRYDYAGPIELKMRPEVEGIALEKSVIEEKKNEVEVVVKTSDKLQPGFFAHIRFVGQGTNNASANVSTVPALKKAFPLILNPPPALDGIVTLVVRGK